MPVVLMKTPSPLPRSTTLVSPVTMVTPAAAAASAMEAATRRRSFDGKAFFDDESGAQIERRGAAHGQIVYRAMDRERADVAAGKEQRLHHERIGSEGQSHAADFENRLVVQAVEHRIREQRQKDVAQQVRAQSPAAAMAEHDFVARRDGGGADE